MGGGRAGRRRRSGKQTRSLFNICRYPRTARYLIKNVNKHLNVLARAPPQGIGSRVKQAAWYFFPLSLLNLSQVIVGCHRRTARLPPSLPPSLTNRSYPPSLSLPTTPSGPHVCSSLRHTPTTTTLTSAPCSTTTTATSLERHHESLKSP